jgi:GNAT superfamily N-acetyltransferase
MSINILLRPYALADAAQVADLINADAMHTIGAPRAVVDAVGNVRLQRYVSPKSERVVACDARGAIIGYAYLKVTDHGIVGEVGGATHPDWWGKGVGSALLGWAEARATKQSQRAPAGVKAVLQVNLFEQQQAALALFEANGFARVREWLHLEVELTEAPAAPELPTSLVIQPMDVDNDWETVGPAMDDAFAAHWGTLTREFGDDAAEEEEPSEEEAPEDDSYSNAPGLCFIALDGDVVAGGVLCNARLVERDDSGRVGSLFVRQAYQRRGIGRALMLAAFGACWQRGLRRIVTDTDAASFSETPRFYASLGMRPYRRELLFEKTVREGEEVRRLER